jgi:hypothetical protein
MREALSQPSQLRASVLSEILAAPFQSLGNSGLRPIDFSEQLRNTLQEVRRARTKQIFGLGCRAPLMRSNPNHLNLQSP